MIMVIFMNEKPAKAPIVRPKQNSDLCVKIRCYQLAIEILERERREQEELNVYDARLDDDDRQEYSEPDFYEE
jgi:hypothetical protein